MVDEQEVKIMKTNIDDIEVSGNPSLISMLQSHGRDWSKVDIPSGKKVAFAISFSRPTRVDLETQGYDVLLEIGSPRQYSADDFSLLAAKTAALITRAAKAISSKNIHIALSCPTALSFAIGMLLGPKTKFTVLHYDNGYRKLPKYEPERVQKKKDSLKPHRI